MNNGQRPDGTWPGDPVDGPEPLDLKWPTAVWSEKVCAPWAHMVWAWYRVCGVHLRDFPGQPHPAKLRWPAATHEIMIVALNPDDNNGILTSINFGMQLQIEGANPDMTCADVTRLIADRIRRRVTNPDTDALSVNGIELPNLARAFAGVVKVEVNWARGCDH